MDTLTNGLSQGDFTTLRVLSGGVMTDVLTLIGSVGGIATLIGAGAAVVTGSGSTRTITVDLSAYATTAAVNTLLANYVLASAYNTAMATKIDTLTAGTNVTITGSGTSRTISATGGSSLTANLPLSITGSASPNPTKHRPTPVAQPLRPTHRPTLARPLLK